MKSKKGYSLIEIAVGIAIITIFLLCTGSLVNASFTNYRMVVQRNEAMGLAIREMENVLQNGLSEEAKAILQDGANTNYEYVITENAMTVTVDIDKITSGALVYDDTVFKVTVNVEYSKTENGTQKYNLELQSLVIDK